MSPYQRNTINDCLTCDKIMIVGIEPSFCTIWRATWVYKVVSILHSQWRFFWTFPLAEPPVIILGIIAQWRIVAEQTYLRCRLRKHHKLGDHPRRTWCDAEICFIHLTVHESGQLLPYQGGRPWDFRTVFFFAWSVIAFCVRDVAGSEGDLDRAGRGSESTLTKIEGISSEDIRIEWARL